MRIVDLLDIRSILLDAKPRNKQECLDMAIDLMAAEGLEKVAKAQNCFIKLETRGSGGAKNVLT